MVKHDDELMRKLLQTFQIEASEHIQTLNQDLLELERQPDDKTKTSLLQEAFRAAHSLKGAARAVTLPNIELLSHHMEEILKLAREGLVTLDPSTCDVLYKTLDSIQTLLNGEELNSDELLKELIALRPEDSKDELPISNNEGVDSKVEKADSTQTENQLEPRDGDETIRVSVSKLDALMTQVGELVAARISAEERANDMHALRRQLVNFPRLWQDVKVRLNRLDHETENVRNLTETLQSYNDSILKLVEDVSEVDTLLNRDSLRLNMVSGQLQDEMRRVRMIPFLTVEAVLQRAVRDAARSEDKVVRLTIKGVDIELDKKVLELLKDPLLHLVRNAVGHGIESPGIREQAGKSREGQINIEITQRGSEAHIVVSDDGQGFQLDAIQKVSRAQPSGQTDVSDDDVIALAFMSGVTTSSEVTTLSGRGIGLDVVRASVETLQGRIRVTNNVGQGSSIQIIVPVSLAMTRVLLVMVNDAQYALPLATIEKIVSPEDVFHVEGQAMLTVDDTPLPFVTLASILSQTNGKTDNATAVIMGTTKQRIALLVDEIMTEQELAVKAFSRPLLKVRHLAGAALLGNGEPVIVLNATDIVRTAQSIREVFHFNSTDESANGATIESSHILVVDDSITTRTLEKNILQAAGFHVETATDGVKALDKLSAHSFDLVIADVEMPNMDGFSLVRHLRESDKHRSLPIILVTSLESDEDRERGMMAGADAYIVKRGFQQAELLSAIRQFL